MSEGPEDAGARRANIHVEQTARDVRGKMTGVEIQQFYGEIIVRPESIEDLPPAPGEPPFKGLAYYTEADAGIFFGREAMTRKLTGRLLDTRFLVLVGASGSGKSSLLRAGVVPALRRQNWLIHTLTPSAHPIRQLANSLTRDDDALAAAGELNDALTHNPQTLAQAADKLATRHSASRLLLLVDQFEELFTLCKEEAQRRAFLDCLLQAAEAQGAATILVGLRADFYDRCLQYEGLRAVMEAQQVTLGQMTAEELLQVVAEPAKRGGWQFVDGLVEQILEDVGREPGRLPLLSHALRETWERRRGTVMTLAGYRAAGGVEGAIAQTAEDTLDDLPPDRRRLVQNIFLSLTELGAGVEDTRRIVSVEDLQRLGAENEVQGVLDRLVRARLVTVDNNSVEVAHEALIRRWPRLRQWLDENRERLRFERQLLQDAREWEALERDPGALYRGARLAQAMEWREKRERGEQLASRVEVFLDASRELAEREAREKEAQRRRELQQAQQLAAEAEARREAEEERARAEEARATEAEEAAAQLRQRRNVALAFAGGALLLAVISLLLYQLANQNAATAADNLATATLAQGLAADNAATAEANAATAEAAGAAAVAARATSDAEARQRATAQVQTEQAAVEAETQAQIALSRQLAAQAVNQANSAQADLGLLLALEAVRQGDTVEARSSLLTGLAENPGLETYLHGHAGQVRDLALSADGRLLASVGCELIDLSSICRRNSVRIWEVAAHRQVQQLVAPEGEQLTSVAFGSDDQLLATANRSGSVNLWDLESGQQRWQSADVGNAVLDLAFSPDGRMLAAGASDALTLWDVESREIITRTMAARSGAELAFSPDGRWLAFVGEENRIRLWDLETAQQPLEAEVSPLSGHEAGISTLSFDADGRFLLSSSQDKRVLLWTLPDPQTPVVLYQNDRLLHAQFVDDEVVAIVLRRGEEGGDLLLLNARTAAQLATIAGSTPLAADPSGNWLAATGLGGTVLVYRQDLSSSLARSLADVQTDTLAFSPDSHILATAVGDDVVLWDPSAERQVDYTLSAHEADVTALAFSPDGRWLASGDRDGRVVRWDLAQDPPRSSIVTEDAHNVVFGLAFSPDGRWLVSGGFDSQVIFWDGDGRRQQTLRAPADVYRLAFSPDGRRLVAGVEDGSIVIWDMQDAATNGRVFATHLPGSEGMTTIAFSAGGASLLSSDLATTMMWDVESGNRITPVYQGGFAAVSADGRLAALDVDGQIAFLDLSTGRLYGQRLGEPDAFVRGIALSPDGFLMAVALDRTVVIYDMNPLSWSHRACAMANRNLTDEEWLRFAGGSERVLHCPDLADRQNLPEDPELLVLQAENDALQGDMARASSEFVQAVALVLETEDATLSNEICWLGTIFELAQEVMPACEHAVDLDPDNGGFRDSRGLARALTGDVEGAIEDFRAYVTWARAGNRSDLLADKRESWIADLQAGKNPFDAITLRQLRSE